MMSEMGYDFNYKFLIQTCFEIMINNELNEKINEITYDYCCKLADDGHIDRLDQTIFTFILAHFFSDKINILPVIQDIITNSRYMQWYYHKSTSKIKINSIAEPMLFNKPCDVYSPPD